MTIGIVNRFNATILIDFSWTLYRSAFRFSEFAVETEQGPLSTGALFGILQLTELLSTNYPCAQIIFCLDGSPVERKQLFEGYKASRKDPNRPVCEEIANAKAMYFEPFKMLGGIPNLSAIYHPEKEADDLIAKLAILNRKAGKDVIIFSSDKDLLQLQQYGANVSKEINEGELVLLQQEYTLTHKDLGVEPQYIPFLRPWKGDASDDIPAAVSRINMPILQDLAIAWHDSGHKVLTPSIMETLIEKISVNNNITDKTRAKLMEGVDQANLNYTLMDLTRYETEAINGVQAVPLAFDEGLINFYKMQKYYEWRTGRSLVATNASALLPTS